MRNPLLTRRSLLNRVTGFDWFAWPCMISIGKRCVQYLPLATTSFTWLHTVRGCTRIRELVQKGGGRPCPISHPNSVYREPYINNCYASHIGFQSPHRISGLGIDHYWSRGHSIRCICTTRSIFQDNATSDDDFEGKHQSKEPGTVEDVQIAIEEAMIEALHLMEKDKIEHAEMLITEGCVPSFFHLIRIKFSDSHKGLI